MNLIDPADLPKSAADGPESWGEAFSKLASTTSTAQQMIENTTSDRSMLENIYAQRIAKIADLTGQTLENPIRSDIGVPGFLQPPFRAAYTTNEQAFDKRVQALSDQHPELQPQFQSLIGGVDDEMNRQRREAEQASGVAANNPNLDPISRFTAQMAGGLAGAARDPFQWQMAIAGGGGGSAGQSVAGRIGKTMLSEFMLNSGQETVLQLASQPRKKAAGLEYGLGNALANIGVAGTFGALFGGPIEAGHALAGLYRMGDGGAEIATRVIEGKPQPGDVETMAKAMGVKLQPQQLEQLNRSFEDRVLDEHMIGPDATPDQQRVFESALRYAEDPDNHPPPEVVERAIADEQAGPARTLTADDYERIYGGDPNAIDDLRGVMQAESLDDAARMIDDQTRAPSQDSVAAAPAAAEPDQPLTFQTEMGSIYEVNGNTTTRNKAARDTPGHEGDSGLKEASARTIYVDSNASELSAAGMSGIGEKGARVIVRDGRAALLTWNDKAKTWGFTSSREGIPFFDEPAVGRYPLELWRSADDVTGYEAYRGMHAGNRIVSMETRARPVDARSAIQRTSIDGRGDTFQLKSPEGDAHLSLKRDGENLKVGITSVSKASRGQGKARQLYEEAVRLADENGGVLRSDVAVSNDATRVYNSLSRRGYDVRRNPDAVKIDKGWIAPDRPGENWVFEVRPRPDPGAIVDPIEGQTIRPRSIAEPGDAEAMRVAEEQAGAIAEPAIDANGNPKTLFDYIPIQDRDGNVRLVSTSEALEIADQGNILADLLEVCQV
jgi:predicted GNAT family acetyltransferase